MKVFRLLIIIWFLSHIGIFGIDSNFVSVKLIKGLPQIESREFQKCVNPFYADLDTHNKFTRVTVVWDSAEASSYNLIVTHKSGNKMTLVLPFPEFNGEVYSSNFSFQSDDEFKSYVPYQLRMIPDKKELQYYWSNSIENGIDIPGGIPQFIKPRLCKGNQMVPLNVSTLNGEQINLKELKGRFVFIDFWGTWCGGCKQQLPNIIKMRDTFDDNDLFILGLAKDDKETLGNFLDKNPLNYPNAILTHELADSCEIKMYPTTVLVDPNGTIINTDMWGENMWETVYNIMKEYRAD